MKQAFRMSYRELRNYLIVFYMTAVAVALILAVNNRVLHIGVMWAVAVCAIILSRVDFLHPYTWFSMIMALYSTAYAIRLAMGMAGNYSYEQLLYPVLGMSVALLFIGPPGRRRAKKGSFFSVRNATGANYNYLDAVIIALTMASVILSAVILRSGFSGKTQMKQANYTPYRVGVYLVRYLTMFTIIRVCNLIRLRRRYFWCFLLNGIATVAFAFSTGERDAYLRLFVVVLLVLYASRSIKIRHLFILIPVTMVMLALSVEFKYYFLRGTLVGSFSVSNLLDSFLSSDFSSAGRNLQYLVDHPWTKGYFGLGMLFTELLYPILPKTVVTNPDRWFNYSVHTTGFRGNAFTLVGTGYVICGAFGVIVLFAVVGLIIRWLYRRSERNIFTYSAYLYSMTIVMVSIRGSLNNIINCLLKEVAVCILFCYCVNYFFGLSGMRRGIRKAPPPMPAKAPGKPVP